MDKFEYLGILEFIMKEETETFSEVPFSRHPSVRKSSKLLEKPSDHARGGFRSLDEKRPSFQQYCRSTKKHRLIGSLSGLKSYVVTVTQENSQLLGVQGSERESRNLKNKQNLCSKQTPTFKLKRIGKKALITAYKLAVLDTNEQSRLFTPLDITVNSPDPPQRPNQKSQDQNKRSQSNKVAIQETSNKLQVVIQEMVQEECKGQEKNGHKSIVSEQIVQKKCLNQYQMTQKNNSNIFPKHQKDKKVKETENQQVNSVNNIQSQPNSQQDDQCYKIQINEVSDLVEEEQEILKPNHTTSQDQKLHQRSLSILNEPQNKPFESQSLRVELEKEENKSVSNMSFFSEQISQQETKVENSIIHKPLPPPFPFNQQNSLSQNLNFQKSHAELNESFSLLKRKKNDQTETSIVSRKDRKESQSLHNSLNSSIKMSQEGNLPIILMQKSPSLYSNDRNRSFLSEKKQQEMGSSLKRNYKELSLNKCISQAKKTAIKDQ